MKDVYLNNPTDENEKILAEYVNLLLEVSEAFFKLNKCTIKKEILGGILIFGSLGFSANLIQEIAECELNKDGKENLYMKCEKLFKKYLNEFREQMKKS